MSALVMPIPFVGNTSFYYYLLRSKISLTEKYKYEPKLELNYTNIINSNGLQRITIPLKKFQTKDILYSEVEISYDIPWPSGLLKSLQSAYGKSPFFEFYEDDLKMIFSQDFRYLKDLNRSIFDFITQEIGLNPPKFFKENEGPIHHTSIIQTPIDGFYYEQVFEKKFGFLQPVSMIDLLFNEGRAACLLFNKTY